VRSLSKHLKIRILHFIALFVVGCSPFHPDRVMSYERDFDEIIEFMEDYETVILDSDEDDRFSEDMRNLGIDYIYKNQGTKNRDLAGFVEESDSLIIFVSKSQSIFQNEKRIIYDFAKRPRNFGSEKLDLAAYEIKQLNDRWYFSTIGFD
jgi:hypothetical protein